MTVQPSSPESIPTGMPMERETRYDPPAALTALQTHPLRRIKYYPEGVEGWLATGHAESRAILADPRFASGEPFVHSPTEMPHIFVAFSQQAPPGFFIFDDPPEHTRLRRKVAGVFTVKRLKKLEPHIAHIVDQRIAALREAGPGADLVSQFALPVPSLVICEMLGVPYADRDQFERDSAAMIDLSASVEERNEAMGRVLAYIHQLIPRIRANPGSDMLSALVADPDLSDAEAAGIGLLLLVAGHETTANMLGLGALSLLEHPEQLAQLRSNPDLMPTAVEELLRYLTVAHNGIMRVAKEDTEVNGHLIRAGEHVTVALQTANRDPAQFDQPDKLDFDRDPRGHLAFGHGLHQCVGQQLARIEMVIGLGKLLEAFPQLRLAVPVEDIPLRSDMAIYGVHSMPVEW
ncbi:cytochrome P450 [Natronoglycomyces albus]|uniref:Cytochrome P450 n=2 Tax=Natronoglycomyces albus TaxID=2811108 RepID=A0A895XPD3_9ACTN|nr:cytochrome P450 [Natronoglycomyces albus]